MSSSSEEENSSSGESDSEEEEAILAGLPLMSRSQIEIDSAQGEDPVDPLEDLKKPPINAGWFSLHFSGLFLWLCSLMEFSLRSPAMVRFPLNGKRGGWDSHS